MTPDDEKMMNEFISIYPQYSEPIRKFYSNEPLSIEEKQQLRNIPGIVYEVSQRTIPKELPQPTSIEETIYRYSGSAVTPWEQLTPEKQEEAKQGIRVSGMAALAVGGVVAAPFAGIGYGTLALGTGIGVVSGQVIPRLTYGIEESMYSRQLDLEAQRAIEVERTKYYASVQEEYAKGLAKISTPEYKSPENLAILNKWREEQVERFEIEYTTQVGKWKAETIGKFREDYYKNLFSPEYVLGSAVMGEVTSLIPMGKLSSFISNKFAIQASTMAKLAIPAKTVFGAGIGAVSGYVGSGGKPEYALLGAEIGGATALGFELMSKYGVPLINERLYKPLKWEFQAKWRGSNAEKWLVDNSDRYALHVAKQVSPGIVFDADTDIGTIMGEKGSYRVDKSPHDIAFEMMMMGRGSAGFETQLTRLGDNYTFSKVSTGSGKIIKMGRTALIGLPFQETLSLSHPQLFLDVTKGMFSASVASSSGFSLPKANEVTASAKKMLEKFNKDSRASFSPISVLEVPKRLVIGSAEALTYIPKSIPMGRTDIPMLSTFAPGVLGASYLTKQKEKLKSSLSLSAVQLQKNQQITEQMTKTIQVQGQKFKQMTTQSQAQFYRNMAIVVPVSTHLPNMGYKSGEVTAMKRMGGSFIRRKPILSPKDYLKYQLIGDKKLEKRFSKIVIGKKRKK